MSEETRSLSPEDYSKVITKQKGEEPHWVRVYTIDEMEAFYKSVLPKMQEAAKKCGYALAVHGSMRRDLDLIASPWVENHSDKDELAKAIQLAACGMFMAEYKWGSTPPKPCGRLGTVFAICWCAWHAMLSAGCVDLAVMPDTSEFDLTSMTRSTSNLEASRDWSKQKLATALGEEIGEQKSLEYYAREAAERVTALELKLEYANKKWQDYERDHILPTFVWATEVDFDLRKAVSASPGRNCTELLIKQMQSLLISGFYEEEFPFYEQGKPHHELQSIATAEELNNLVGKLKTALLK
jgi:hypothetical protein